MVVQRQCSSSNLQANKLQAKPCRRPKKGSCLKLHLPWFDPIHSLAQPGACQSTWRMHLQSGLPPPASLSPLNNLSQGNWPPTISPIRGAMHLNATNAEILLQMMHSSVPPRSVQYFAQGYLWVAPNLALPCIHSTFHLSVMAIECSVQWYCYILLHCV